MQEERFSLGSMFNFIEAKFSTEHRTLKLIAFYFSQFQRCLKGVEKLVCSVADLDNHVPESSYSAKLIVSSLSAEFDSCIKEVCKIENFNRKSVIEPLEGFAQMYDVKHKYFSKKKKEIIGNISDIKNSVESDREKYFKHAKELDLLQSNVKKELKENDLADTGINQTSNIMEEYELAVMDYKRAVTKANESIGTKVKEFEVLAEMMLQYDEERIEILKSLLDKHRKSLEDLGKVFLHSAAAVKGISNIVSSDSDAEFFITTHQNQPFNPLFTPLRYEEYPYRNSQLSALEGQISDTSKEKTVLKDSVQESVDKSVLALINPEVTLSLETKAELLRSMGDPRVGSPLIERLSLVNQPIRVVTEEAFSDMGDIVNCMLNSYRKTQVFNEESLIVVINAANYLYTMSSGKQKYFFSLIASNLMWQDVNVWEGIIQTEIPVSYTHLTLPTICSV
eukprot:TRINITY_DN10829_c0_g1_i4.p1 TRINITY_DN10829_c0_g1~~TRINITY_DN10829_c0_g1_i4.p1  ORF type:complete len:451 (+),score=126.30 TRINITY_DN10829_c0_g1_i4:84-1436(+)